jgi:type III secretion system FlhB-like substrate exporter
VAKGTDALAARIREAGRAAGVPIISRPPLARALWKLVPEGKEIPSALYHAVAEVLAYVYRLRDRRAGRPVVSARARRRVAATGPWPSALVGVLAVTVAPLPPMLFDLLLGAALCLAALTFLVAFYVERPTDFSAFPALLLFVTLFRLALNVASTRLILTHGGRATTRPAR